MFGKEENINAVSMSSSKTNHETIIGKAVKIEGTLTAKENIKIEGIVEGKIKTDKDLYIGEGAVINADIEVNSAEIAGDLKGNILAREKLILTSTAKINGNVKAKIVSIAEGAVLNGQCVMGSEINSNLHNNNLVKDNKNTENKNNPNNK